MMRPGGIELTVMPCLPTSRDRPFAHECIAAFAQKAPLMPSGSDLPVMLTMRPQLRAIICLSSLWVSWRWRVKLRVSASSHCSSLASSVNLRLPPALFTRMSTAPRPFNAASAIFVGASSCMKSHSMMTSGLLSSFWSSSRRLRRRATTARRTPSLASAVAMPRPMPMLAPVTSAVFPAMPRSMRAQEYRARLAGGEVRSTDDDEDHEQRDPQGEAPADQLLLDRKQRLVRHLPPCITDFLLFVHGARGGLTPAKKRKEIASPTQITKPKRDRAYTAASRPMPSSQSLRKSDITPMVKNVMTKKMPRNAFASFIAARTLAAVSAALVRARTSTITKVATKPRMNFGKRSQISPARTLSPGRTLIFVVQIQARMNAQMPM